MRSTMGRERRGVALGLKHPVDRRASRGRDEGEPHGWGGEGGSPPRRTRRERESESGCRAHQRAAPVGSRHAWPIRRGRRRMLSLGRTALRGGSPSAPLLRTPRPLWCVPPSGGRRRSCHGMRRPGSRCIKRKATRRVWPSGFPSDAADLAAGGSQELRRFGIRHPGAEDHLATTTFAPIPRSMPTSPRTSPPAGRATKFYDRQVEPRGAPAGTRGWQQTAVHLESRGGPDRERLGSGYLDSNSRR